MHDQQAQQEIDPLIERTAGLRLLHTYSTLSKNHDHLLHDIIGYNGPRQWEHYPIDDAIDHFNGYQWFYHSHSPEDRASTREHGHIHLFSRRFANERSATDQIENSASIDVRHLLGIGFDAQGIPISVFTVNSWVTGDSMLSITRTIDLLFKIKLNTGYENIDTVITSVIHLCFSEIQEVLLRRDQILSSHNILNQNVEFELDILSETSVDLDEKLRHLF